MNSKKLIRSLGQASRKAANYASDSLKIALSPPAWESSTGARILEERLNSLKNAGLGRNPVSVPFFWKSSNLAIFGINSDCNTALRPFIELLFAKERVIPARLLFGFFDLPSWARLVWIVPQPMPRHRSFSLIIAARSRDDLERHGPRIQASIQAGSYLSEEQYVQRLTKGRASLEQEGKGSERVSAEKEAGSLPETAGSAAEGRSFSEALSALDSAASPGQSEFGDSEEEAKSASATSRGSASDADSSPQSSPQPLSESITQHLSQSSAEPRSRSAGTSPAQPSSDLPDDILPQPSEKHEGALVHHHFDEVGESSSLSKPHPPELREEQAKLLVVEADPLLQDMFQGVLGSFFQTVVAGTQEEAKAKVEADPPEIVLCDLDLPNDFSLELLQWFSENLSDVPLLAIGSRPRESRRRLFELGAMDIVRKPFDVGELLARLQRSARVSRRLVHLQQQARTDVLTGLGNRRAWEIKAEKETERISRYGGTLSVVALDVDNLKKLNDEYGHAAGDQLIRVVADLIAGGIRSTDFAARIGGDEFLILLPQVGAEEALSFAQRLVSEGKNRVLPGGEPLSMTAGVAQLIPPEGISGVLQRADLALFRAKRSGKGRVLMAES